MMPFLLAVSLTCIYKHQSITSCTCYSIVLFSRIFKNSVSKAYLIYLKGGSNTVL